MQTKKKEIIRLEQKSIPKIRNQKLFFEKIAKINNSLARLGKNETRHKSPMSGIRGGVTRDLKDIKRNEQF